MLVNEYQSRPSRTRGLKPGIRCAPLAGHGSRPSRTRGLKRLFDRLRALLMLGRVLHGRVD